MNRNATSCLLLAALALPANAGELRESVSVRSGGVLEIRLDYGSVEVGSHANETVDVEARAEGFGAGNMRFELTSDGDDARLVGRSQGWFPLLSGSSRVRVRVALPERYSLELHTGGGAVELRGIGGWVRARTSGGAIELDGADGPVELETSGGSVRAEDVRGDLQVRTSGGWVRIDQVQGRVDARTSGGEIRVDEAGGPVHARTSGGAVSVRFSGAPEGELETSGGSIEAEFPAEFGADLDAQTSGGRVRVEPDIRLSGEIDTGHVIGRLNGGGPELRLRTSGGNVRVRAR